MPFCSQCGSGVSTADVFCGRCGARQPVSAPFAGVPPDLAGGLSPRTAAILCYVPWLGWIAAIIVLASEKFRADQAVRFHAFQGLYLFVAYLVDEVALRPFDHMLMPVPHISRILELVLVGASVYMMVKASQGATCSLPLVGDLARRSTEEQGRRA